MELTTISPAPSDSASRATATTGFPVLREALCVHTSYAVPIGCLLTSKTTTTLWLPISCAIMEISRGFSIDAETDDLLGLVYRLDAAPVAQRHAALHRQMRDALAAGRRALGRSVDVEHDQLIRFLLIEDLHGVDGIADVLGIPELHGFHQAAVLDQQTRDDSGSQQPTARRNSSGVVSRSDGSFRDGTARRRCYRRVRLS